MKRVYCDVPTCGKEYNSHVQGAIKSSHPFNIKIETYERLPNGQSGRQVDICWDCIIQALMECNPLSEMPPKDTPPSEIKP